MKILDSKAVQEIANANPTSEALFVSLSRRERNRSEIDVERMRQNLVAEGFHIVPEAVVETFVSLHNAGIGELVKGKSGRASRFRFHFGLKEVAKAGAPAEKVERLLPTALSRTFNGDTRIVVLLQDDRKASITVPSDLSDEEIEIIVKRALNKRN